MQHAVCSLHTATVVTSAVPQHHSDACCSCHYHHLEWRWLAAAAAAASLASGTIGNSSVCTCYNRADTSRSHVCQSKSGAPFHNLHSVPVAPSALGGQPSKSKALVLHNACGTTPTMQKKDGTCMFGCWVAAQQLPGLWEHGCRLLAPAACGVLDEMLPGPARLSA